MGACGLFLLLIGIINIIHDNWLGHYFLAFGAILLIYMLVGWFSEVINEGLQGLHSEQVDRTYRWGMVWFIATEVAFFGTFFATLFYTRFFVVPALSSGETHTLLWPKFKAAWPLLNNPNQSTFPGPAETIPAWGIPALNTFLLLSSALAITWALWALTKKRRKLMTLGVFLTILLGFSFLCMQAYEYIEAYTHLRLTLHSGIYGTTFFMLTGFHAAHVMVGLIMLIVILIRCLKGHFQPHHHFAFEAVSWYWHFVDVVWLFLFVFVYWL
jgi:cytochrome c oxidase subunit 3